MSVSGTQIIYVKADEKPVREGTLTFTQFSSGDRMGRAFAALGLCWVAAGLTVFIPLAHFILTPGFFIGGIILAMKKYKAERLNDNVQVQCPRCDKSVMIELEPEPTLPAYVYCPDCNASLQLTEK